MKGRIIHKKDNKFFKVQLIVKLCLDVIVLKSDVLKDVTIVTNTVIEMILI